MEFNGLFLSATLFFFVFEFGLSYALADSCFFDKKGFFTDICAAALMWGLSYLVYFAADAVELDCKTYGGLPGYDQAGCENYAGNIQTVGDVLNTTFSVNPIIAATVLFVLFSMLYYGYKLRQSKT